MRVVAWFVAALVVVFSVILAGAWIVSGYDALWRNASPDLRAWTIGALLLLTAIIAVIVLLPI